MTHDFDRARASAHSSAIARTGRRLMTVAASAWTSSAIGGSWRRTREAFAHATPARRVWWWAFTIGVASAVHLVIRSFLSTTVAPGMPIAVYIVIAAASAVIAWKADAFHRAWRGSKVARAFGKFDQA